MKVGLVSDTHGNLTLLKKVAGVLKTKEKVDVLIHLGDDLGDAAVIDGCFSEIIRIPGVFSNYYFDPAVANREIREFGKFKVLLTHSPKAHANDLSGDLKPEDVAKNKQVDAIFYGHTHIPAAEVKKGILWVNPGHLKLDDRKGHAPTYAVVEFQKSEIRVDIKDAADSTPVHSITYP